MQNKLIHEVRAVKTKKELQNIIAAQRISEKVLRYIVAKLKTRAKAGQAGITEIEVANMIKREFTKLGVPILSFPPIVAFGKGSGDIHHIPGKTKLKKFTRRGGADIIMFDFGTTVNGYCSDMTRTYFWGKPSSKQKKVYESVLEAQERAIKQLEAGEKRAKVVDKTARDFLAKKYKNNFKHGLGHGVGTVIHEWPNFKPKSEDVLPVGCVMTVEPGVYLKGFGGVRIEDMLVITKNGARNLTNVPKDFESAILAG